MAEQENNIFQAEAENRKQLYRHLRESLNRDDIDDYRSDCINFEFQNKVFGGSKSREVFENTIKEVNPNIRFNNTTKTKNLLRGLCKLFVQELA